MPQISSPARRVLGEKDANASLNITSPQRTTKAGGDTSHHSSTKQTPGAVLSKPELVSSMLQAGRKRSINEVEGVEVQDWHGFSRSSQATEIISDSASESDRVGSSLNIPSAGQSHAYTSMTSFGISQPEQNSLEPQFELPPQEMSQRTLDKMHAVPMPEINSQTHMYTTHHPTLAAESTQGSVGMSSLIDFGGSDASQGSDRLLNAKERDNEGPDGVPRSDNVIGDGQPKQLSEEEQRKALMDQKAAELRTRLQFAYFKVQTNQTTTPFSRLKVPESMRRAISPQLQSRRYSTTPPRHSTSSVNGKHEKLLRLARTSQELSPESHVAAMRAQATAQSKPVVRSLDSLPVPTLQPTNFAKVPTARQLTPEDERTSTDTIEIPSSPPISRRSTPAALDDTKPAMHSPPATKEPSRATIQSNEQLSSPPPSQDGNSDKEEDADESTPRAKPPNLQQPSGDVTASNATNSPVKGEAADGLLQLMRGVGGGKGMCGL